MADSWLDSIGNTASGAWSSVSTVVSDGMDSIEASYDAAIADFKAKLAQLDQAQSNLLAVQELAQQNPADYQEWQNQQNKIDALATTINSVKGAVGDVTNWWSNLTSDVGYLANSMGLNGLKGRMGKLGFLPAIPVATAVAVTAAIAAVIISVNLFVSQMNQKYNNAVVQNTQAREQYRQTLQSQGTLSAEDIEAQVNQVYPMITATPELGFTGQIGDLLKLGIVAAFVFYLIKEKH